MQESFWPNLVSLGSKLAVILPVNLRCLTIVEHCNVSGCHYCYWPIFFLSFQNHVVILFSLYISVTCNIKVYRRSDIILILMTLTQIGLWVKKQKSTSFLFCWMRRRGWINRWTLSLGRVRCALFAWNGCMMMV